MVDRIKLSMRIKNDALDLDIQSNINVALADLKRVGLKPALCVESTDNILIYKCCEFYCKWQFDFNRQGDRFEKAYSSLRDALSLDNEMVGGDENG